MISDLYVHLGEKKQWLACQSPVQIVQTSSLDQLLSSLRLIEEIVNREQLFAVGFISYEAAPAFDSALVTRNVSGLPLLWFGLYSDPKDVALPTPSSRAYQIGSWQPTMSRSKYQRGFEAIKARIAAGDTYQVNYTMRLRSRFSGDPFAFFADLARSQPSQFAAYLDIGDHVVCSVSPELFFELDRDQLTCRPMKGTRKRGRYNDEDNLLADELTASSKERAENVMVVDMIRNDLGRIAEFGSVAVPELFTVERYPTVWQMTSKVAARTQASISEIMTALFPCASVTGPPKPSTMRIISELETTPRGLYTGCIGYIAPGRRARFSVAIRTAVVDRRTSTAEYGVGGGIVWDSQCEAEHEECLTKAAVLERRTPEFALLETLLWQPGSGFALLERHLNRLSCSAVYFDRPVDLDRVRSALQNCMRDCPSVPHKVRLIVNENGEVTCEAHALPEQPRFAAAVPVILAAHPIDSANPFLYHKTTHREIYDQASVDAPAGGDVILWNERGEITESTIANIVAEIDGILVTPTVKCGLLPGTFRQDLLDRGRITERVITIAEFKSSPRIFLINSVRGWMPARLLNQPAASRHEQNGAPIDEGMPSFRANSLNIRESRP